MRGKVRGFCMAGLAGLAITVNTQSVGTPKAGVPITKVSIDVSPEIAATGCLVKEGNKYVLENAAVEVVPWLSPNVSQNAVGPRKPSVSKTAFMLQNQTDLDPHVGHTIEVTGVVAPATANLPPSPDTIAPARGVPGVPQAGGPGGRGVNRVAHPEIDNKTVKVISPSCSPR